jgi:uncharacterized protein YndB with AHSA1/START domain
MSLKKEASGSRSVQLEFEVPGTPEQVWQAIATGPGISSWFVPSRVEERVGGAVAFELGGGMESSGVVTGWEPPRRFAYEEPDWSPGAPPLATEFLVESRSGDACVVRIVHSLFTSSDEWDDQVEGFEAGWTSFFDILRIYLAHFVGQPCSPLRLMGTASGSEAEAWDGLAAALGLAGAVPGERRNTAASGAPALSGIVERDGKGKSPHEILLRLDEPAPGVALIGAYAWGGQAHAAISLFLYGDRAPAAMTRDEPLWQAWMSRHFKPLGDASNAA